MAWIPQQENSFLSEDAYSSHYPAPRCSRAIDQTFRPPRTFGGRRLYVRRGKRGSNRLELFQYVE